MQIALIKEESDLSTKYPSYDDHPSALLTIFISKGCSHPQFFTAEQEEHVQTSEIQSPITLDKVLVVSDLQERGDVGI